MRHICDQCFPDNLSGDFAQGKADMVDRCDLCGRKEGSDYGNVQVHSYFADPLLPTKVPCGMKVEVNPSHFQHIIDGR